MTDDADLARTVVVRGRVQGVGFRASCAQRANALGLAGWVRNEPDGSVALWMVGPATAIDELTAWCRQGPRMARVTDVRVIDGPASHGPVSGFHVR